MARVVQQALGELGDVALGQLRESGMDASVLDSRSPTWHRLLDDQIMPAVAKVYADAFNAEARDVLTAAVQSPEPGGVQALANEYGTRYLTTARNRMVGVSDTVFSQITTALEEGRQARIGPDRQGESIPQLSARVEALLSDKQRWAGRATVVARTEVIAANNAGGYGAASANASVFGYSDAQVAKEWLATHDSRTRPTHQTADGQVVLGMATTFVVGASDLQYPGDPSGAAREVVQCRCTTLYHYPGDPSYPPDLVTSATPDGPQPEESYVTKLHDRLVEGTATTAQLRAALDDASVSALGKVNVRAALDRYEQHLADEAARAFAPREFTGAAEARDWAHSVWGGHERYTRKQYEALRGYTGSRYGPMNNTLRTYKGRRVTKEIEAMDAAIEAAARTPEDLVAVRTTSLRQLGITKGTVTADDVKALVGQEFVDYGYMSATLSRQVTIDRTSNVRLNIEVRRGSKGAYVSGSNTTPKSQVISEVGRGETELILARGSRLRVLAVRKAGSGWQVDAELIQD